MKIQILDLIEGAKKAEGLTVIIDVFRAMTVEAYLLNNGAKDVIPIGSLSEAENYRLHHPGTILIGERGGKKCEGFDFGNSPSQIKNFDFSGRTIVHTTSAGTQGIVNARNASEILLGALVNARATAEYLRAQRPEIISLVCMGLEGKKITREDRLCAEYLRALLLSESFDLRPGIEECRHDDGAKFFTGNEEVFPEEDFFLSTEADRFDFALKLEKRNDGCFHTVKVSSSKNPNTFSL